MGFGLLLLVGSRNVADGWALAHRITHHRPHALSLPKPNPRCTYLPLPSHTPNTKTTPHQQRQTLATRGRKDVTAEGVSVHVCVFAFDLLYLNGESWVKKPLRCVQGFLFSLCAGDDGCVTMGGWWLTIKTDAHGQRSHTNTHAPNTHTRIYNAYTGSAARRCTSCWAPWWSPATSTSPRTSRRARWVDSCLCVCINVG